MFVFEQLFDGPQTLARHRDGPLAEDRCRYLAHCAEQQMTTWTLRGIARYILIVAETLRLAERFGEPIIRAEIEAAADRWVGRLRKGRRSSRRSWLRFTGNAIRWLTFLGRLQPLTTPTQPYVEHIRRFADHMLRDCGFSPLTVKVRCRTVHRFLTRIDEAGLRLDSLTVPQLNEQLSRMVWGDRYARVTIQNYASNLQAFFRYAEACGDCRVGLAAAVMAPRSYSQSVLPIGPSWEDVSRLIATTQGGRPVDIRDRALLLLLAIYALRAGEVVRLRLEHFDWEQELLTIAHGKRPKPRIYPLCRSVGDAVLCYLRQVRPRSTCRQVFLTLRAPFRPLSCAGLGSVVSQRFHALGVKLTHYGPHSLRHACATHLLTRGLSLKEIGDHLGHQSPESTRIYAKVDLTGLRAVGDFSLEGLL